MAALQSGADGSGSGSGAAPAQVLAQPLQLLSGLAGRLPLVGQAVLAAAGQLASGLAELLPGREDARKVGPACLYTGAPLLGPVLPQKAAAAEHGWAGGVAPGAAARPLGSIPPPQNPPKPYPFPLCPPLAGAARAAA
jgi:hypothetical protein